MKLINGYLNFLCIFGPSLAELSEKLTINAPIIGEFVKGWIRMEQDADGLDIEARFNLTLDESIGSIRNKLEFSIAKYPIIYGYEGCVDAHKTALLSRINFTEIQTNGQKINEIVSIKRAELADLLDGSLMTYVNGKLDSCSNLMEDNVEFLQSKFYGPEVGGDVYYFWHESLNLLKIYSRIVNANNFDPVLAWSLKKHWWLPRQDGKEPSVLSCREKSKNAYFWHQPDANDSATNLIRPESRQMIVVKGLNLTWDNLVKSVLVLEKTSNNRWESKKASGCSRLRPILGDLIENSICLNGEVLRLSQKSLFSPLKIKSEEIGLDDRCYASENAVVDFGRTLEDGHSIKFSIDKSLLHFPAGISIPKNYSNTVVVRYSFPITGNITLYQTKTNPDSITILKGSLISLFDDNDDMPIDASLQIMKLPTESELDAMSCFKYKEVFNPSSIDDLFCQKSISLCPIGKTPLKFSINAYNSTKSRRIEFQLIAKNLPLDGAFSVVGQTMKILTPNLQACANITSTQSRNFGARLGKFDGSGSKQVSKDEFVCKLNTSAMLNAVLEPQIMFSVASFHDSVFNGSVYFAQFKGDETYAVPEENTAIHLVPTLDDNDMLFDIVDINGTKSCRTAEVYNPFGIDLNPATYTKACASDASLCAIGDLGRKWVNLNETMSCLQYVPLSGAFSVNAKSLRISRKMGNRFETTCSAIKKVFVKDVIIRADNKYGEVQIEELVAKDLNIDVQSIKIQPTKVKKISAVCNAYRISLFGPEAIHLAEALQTKIKDDSFISRTLRTIQCSSRSRRIYYSSLTLVIAPLLLFRIV